MPTQIVGAALLRGEWKEAVNMILDAREGDILFFSFSFLPQRSYFFDQNLQVQGNKYRDDV